MNGKLLRQILDKMLKGPVAQEARVQVCLPDGKYYDIISSRFNKKHNSSYES
jgi:hypothetical protein